MAAMGTIEKYYADMQNARLSEAKSENQQYADLQLQYSTDDFLQSVRQIDVYSLDKGSANFAKHEEIVKEFSVYRRTIAQELSKRFQYEGVKGQSRALPGQLKDIGSCWDGSKVGDVNEMDSLYVMDHHGLIVKKSGMGCYRVYLGKETDKHEITPRRLRSQFTDVYDSLVCQEKVPDCLQHGGFNSSLNAATFVSSSQQTVDVSSHSYSGVRYNGPAVTSQFRTKDNSLLTWDITPVLLLPDSEWLENIIRKIISPIIAENPGKMLPHIDVHLFPDAIDNVWRLSTAHMEANILRDLSSDAPMKKAPAICKVLFSWLQEWNGENVAQTASDCEHAPLDILTQIDQVLAAGDSTEKERRKRKMRYAHIWIPSAKRSRYNEAGKGNISVNTAALKHILIKAGLTRQGAFAPKEDPKLALQLTREVFTEIGNENAFTTDHALLPETRISHFSLLACVATEKYRLANQICMQCQTILSEVMSEVTVHFRC